MKPRKPRRRSTALKLRLKAYKRKEAAQQPVHTYAVLQQQLKGEDVLFAIGDLSAVSHGREDLGHWSVYAVCDGHGGTGAAKFVRMYLGTALARLLPAGSPPPPESQECEEFCRSVRHALVKSFVSLNDAFASEGFKPSGTTVAVCLVCDWLMTTANVADSEVFLDLGHSVMEMTNSHKIETNKTEIERLLAANADLRRLSCAGSGPALACEVGRGPLRVWPGGLAMSRSLGDLDSDPVVVPVPHIRQIWLPKEGSRLVMASDGLWDHVTGVKACRLIHNLPLLQAPKRLLRAARANRGFLVDDISILVLDIMPQEGFDFSERRRLTSSGMFTSLPGYLCHSALHAKLKKASKTLLYADADGLEEFPNSLDYSLSEICEESTKVEAEEVPSRESTTSSDNWDVCECSWDCAVDAAECWEKDDRDILDTAQNFVTSSSAENGKSSSVKISYKHPPQMDAEKMESSRDLFLDTSMTETPTMTTIYEPEDEGDKGQLQ